MEARLNMTGFKEIFAWVDAVGGMKIHGFVSYAWVLEYRIQNHALSVVIPISYHLFKHILCFPHVPFCLFLLPDPNSNFLISRSILKLNGLWKSPIWELWRSVRVRSTSYFTSHIWQFHTKVGNISGRVVRHFVRICHTSLIKKIALHFLSLDSEAESATNNQIWRVTNRGDGHTNRPTDERIRKPIKIMINCTTMLFFTTTILPLDSRTSQQNVLLATIYLLHRSHFLPQLFTSGNTLFSLGWKVCSIFIAVDLPQREPGRVFQRQTKNRQHFLLGQWRQYYGSKGSVCKAYNSMKSANYRVTRGHNVVAYGWAGA